MPIKIKTEMKLFLIAYNFYSCDNRRYLQTMKRKVNKMQKRVEKNFSEIRTANAADRTGNLTQKQKYPPRNICIALCFFLIFSGAGCGLVKPKETITFTMRHVYGDQSHSPINNFIEQFNLDEKYFDDRLLIFPIAKSSELLYVNNTEFNRFASDTGASLGDLSTWEGLFKTAGKYHEWTNKKTSVNDIGGKTFIVYGYPFHYFQVGVSSLGAPFF